MKRNFEYIPLGIENSMIISSLSSGDELMAFQTLSQGLEMNQVPSEMLCSTILNYLRTSSNYRSSEISYNYLSILIERLFGSNFRSIFVGNVDDWNLFKDTINELHEFKSKSDPLRLNNLILICKLICQTLHLENTSNENDDLAILSHSILKYCKDKDIRNYLIKILSIIEWDTLSFEFKLTMINLLSYFINVFLKSSSVYEVLIGQVIEEKFRSMKNKDRIFFIDHVKLNRIYIFDYLLISMYESCLKGSQEKLKRSALKQKRDENKLFEVYFNRRPLIQSNAYHKLNWTTCLMLILSLIVEFIDKISDKSKYEPQFISLRCDFEEDKDDMDKEEIEICELILEQIDNLLNK